MFLGFSYGSVMDQNELPEPRSTTAEELIRQTLARYCMFCDDGRFEDWGLLFTQETKLHVMGTTHSGRERVQAFIEAGQPPELRGKHVVINPLILVSEDARSAQCWSDFLFIDRAGVITTTGRYHDELVLEPDGVWRFAVREIVFTGKEPQLLQSPPA
jgi:3-phenylpropionate/cinnamic acid dioxygenase small subunit